MDELILNQKKIKSPSPQIGMPCPKGLHAQKRDRKRSATYFDTTPIKLWSNVLESLALDRNVSNFTMELARFRTSGVSLLSFWKKKRKVEINTSYCPVTTNKANSFEICLAFLETVCRGLNLEY